jgi:hypothetical protein
LAPSGAVSLLERARAAADSLEARLLLAAAVQEVALGVGARCVVSGGTAVDFYAAGALGTSESLPAKWQGSHDVDLVVFAFQGLRNVRADVLAALEDVLGLQPQYQLPGVARVVDVPSFPYGLEIVGDELNGDPKAERVFTVLLDERHPLTLRGPEDVILAYAESGWDTRHGRDWERALAVYAAMRDRLDVRWMIDEARRRGKDEVLQAIMQMRPSPWRRAP